MAVLPLITAAFAAGIVVASTAAVPAVVQLVITPAAFAASWILYLLKKKKPALVLLLFLFCCLGTAAASLAFRQLQAPLQPFLEAEGDFTGYISSVLPEDGEVSRFVFYAAEISLSNGRTYELNAPLMVRLYNAPAGFAPVYGLPLQLRGRIRLPRGQRNPGGFNYARYLEANGIGGLLYVEGGSVSVLPGHRGNFFTSFWENLRLRAKKIIFSCLPQAEASLAAGMLLGQRAELAEPVLAAYQELGLAHLLAVSGLHAGFVAAFALFVSTRLFRGRSFAFRLLLTSFLLASYALLTGGNPPVWRASFSLLAALFARQAGRETDGVQLLSASALLLLIIRPLWLFSLSFQLSYAAAFGILTLSPRILFYLKRLPPALATPLSVAAGAQLATMPFAAVHFGTVSLLAVPLNLICIPLVGAFMHLGLAALLSGLFYLPAAKLLFLTTLPLLIVLDRLPQQLARLTIFSRQLPFLSPVFWGVYTLLLFAFAAGYKLHPLNGRKLLIMMLVANLVFFSAFPFPGRGKLQITFLDVGQGLAVHIETPSGRHLLVDAGSEKSGENVILPYFRRKNIRRLSLLVLTHPHDDHYGGMQEIMAKLPVEAFASSGMDEDSDAFYRLKSLIDESGIPNYKLAAGYSISIDGVQISVLSPPAEYFAFTADDANNNSLVMRVAYGDFRCLLTGDAAAAAIDRLAKEYKEDIETDVLQVPHHGSRGSADDLFLQLSSPHTAVVSVGSNPFGHPHAETLYLLAKHNIRVYRTDLHGAVTITTDGSFWRAAHFAGEAPSQAGLFLSYKPLVWL